MMNQDKTRYAGFYRPARAMVIPHHLKYQQFEVDGNMAIYHAQCDHCEARGRIIDGRCCMCMMPSSKKNTVVSLQAAIDFENMKTQARAIHWRLESAIRAAAKTAASSRGNEW